MSKQKIEEEKVEERCECGCKKVIKEEGGDVWICKNCNTKRFWV